MYQNPILLSWAGVGRIKLHQPHRAPPGIFDMVDAVYRNRGGGVVRRLGWGAGGAAPLAAGRTATRLDRRHVDG